MKTILAIDAKLYRNTGSFASPSWTEVENVKDLSLALEGSEADVSTREGGGWKAVKKSLKDATLEFGMVADPDDADYNAIRAAYFGNSQVEFLVLDGAIGTSGSEGLRASMEILKFSRGEPLEEALMTDVSMKPGRVPAAEKPDWYIVS